MSKLSPYAKPFVYQPECEPCVSYGAAFNEPIYFDYNVEANYSPPHSYFYKAYDESSSTNFYNTLSCQNTRYPRRKKKVTSKDKSCASKQIYESEWPQLKEEYPSSSASQSFITHSTLPKSFNEALKSQPKIVANPLITRISEEKNSTLPSKLISQKSDIPKCKKQFKKMVSVESTDSNRSTFKDNKMFPKDNSYKGLKKLQDFNTENRVKYPITESVKKDVISENKFEMSNMDERNIVKSKKTFSNDKKSHGTPKMISFSKIDDQKHSYSGNSACDPEDKAVNNVGKDSEWEDVEELEKSKSKLKGKNKKKQMKSKQLGGKELLKCFSNRNISLVNPEVFSHICSSAIQNSPENSSNFIVNSNEYPDLNSSIVNFHTPEKLSANDGSPITTDEESNILVRPVPVVVQQTKKMKKSKNLITIDLASSLLESKTKKETVIEKKSRNQIAYVANPLDSTAPKVRRRKEREVPKKRRPSAMRRIIQKEKMERKLLENRLSNTGSDFQEINTEATTTTEEVPQDKGLEVNQVPKKSDEELLDPLEKLQITDFLHNKKFREYCDQMILKDLNEAVTNFLQDMVRFQNRQFQKNPIKARSRSRFCVGLREVPKHLINKKIKLVIIAPNIERIESKGGLDDAVSQIKNIAQEQNVPYVFALNRYVLGKILLKKVGVSCIGVFDASGSEHYNKVLKLASEGRESYNSQVKATLVKYFNDVRNTSLQKITNHSEIK